MMKYQDYRYLYPPRPERKIAPTDLRHVEDMKWLGQAKMNGTCCVIYVSPDKSSIAMGRHGSDNKLDWQPGNDWQVFVKSLAPSWHVFVGELLHNKVKGGPRNTIYLFDLLVSNSNYLIGKTYAERLRLLSEIAKPRSEEDLYSVVSTGVWLTKSRQQNFREWFEEETPAMVEGLVFKNPKAPLLPCSRESSNNTWQIKCRRPKANLSF